MKKPIISLHEKLCLDIALDPERDKKLQRSTPAEAAAVLATAQIAWDKLKEYLKKNGGF